LVVIAEVAAFITTIGFFASVATGATAKAEGVSAKPARISTLSLTTNSCARRLLTSPAVPGLSSLMISSTLRPPKVSPLVARYNLTPCSICLP
jgi:hypothetical protein